MNEDENWHLDDGEDGDCGERTIEFTFPKEGHLDICSDGKITDEHGKTLRQDYHLRSRDFIPIIGAKGYIGRNSPRKFEIFDVLIKKETKIRNRYNFLIAYNLTLALGSAISIGYGISKLFD